MGAGIKRIQAGVGGWGRGEGAAMELSVIGNEKNKMLKMGGMRGKRNLRGVFCGKVI